MAEGPALSALLRRSRISHRLRVPAGVPESDPPIAAVCEDSREVTAGALFCCVRGRAHDGHDFAAGAAAAGAAALMVERPLPVALPQAVVPQVPAALGPVALAQAGSPQEHLQIVGVTGTNGKTTVTHLLSAVLGAGGRRCTAVGSLDGGLTTPRATELAQRLAGARRSAAAAVALEVSSHGLAQRRVDGLAFAAAAFTNLSPEHLDYHRDMEGYFRAKRMLFEADRTAISVICTDDPWGRRLAAEAHGDVRVCSLADAEILQSSARGSRFRWQGTEISLPLGGAHNVANAVVAATVAQALGAEAADVRSGLEAPPRLPGRFEVVAEEPALVVVDFAHSPAALEQLLSAGRDLASGRARLTVVFGCGGDRDTAKRGAMGAVASRCADRVIITSDNPRREDPASIAGAIMAGAGAGSAEIELDRRRAIAAALDGARAGDVIVVAGKGHETTQTIGDRVIPFDDREVARQLLAAGREVSAR
ncbi:MAG: UDP-N-acetylmuramoyl-L-alanyl-D-glutamate--2,6-diaminopimelate ligase [bacterium]|nr:UDP-N-acetylmuramoyl-L-alanyl-D-glutamate--2,6-diaminopimelate ligase [bacterium]